MARVYYALGGAITPIPGRNEPTTYWFRCSKNWRVRGYDWGFARQALCTTNLTEVPPSMSGRPLNTD